MASDGVFLRYWRAYGGGAALIRSYYFWVSIFLSMALYPHWTNPSCWDDILGITPSVLGFSLGVFAILLTVGSDGFRAMMSGADDDGRASPYMEINSSFVHFILLQVLALVLAIFCKAYSFSISKDSFLHPYVGEWIVYAGLFGYWFSYFIFIYSLLAAVAATMALFRVSSLYDLYQAETKSKSKRSDMDSRDMH